MAINAIVPPEQFGALTPEEAAAARAKVYEDEVAKGTEPAVAESLARLAEVANSADRCSIVTVRGGLDC